MAQATLIREFPAVERTAPSALSSGDIFRDEDGLACVYAGLRAAASGDTVACLKAGVFEITKASGTVFAKGDEVWWDDSAVLAVRRLNGSAAAGDVRLGTATADAASGTTKVRVELNSDGNQHRILTALETATTHSGTASETIIGTAYLPAGSLKEGTSLEFVAGIRAPSTNSTDTFRYRVRLGGISGTVVADSTAIDLANDDVCVINGRVNIHTDGAGGSGGSAALTMLKTTITPTVADIGGLDTTSEQTLVLTATHSTNSASNQSVPEVFIVNLEAA